ncbi:MAG: 16S rRNA (adenine(1518)-N(6)/adenine(1519)-N(6))-dimethyltransferase RsmA [Terriglobia bacterium]
MRHARRPKLGQHFLRDPRFSRQIEEAILLEPGELLVEIGPGQGEMTRRLFPLAHRLVAIELDPDLAAALQREFQGNPSVEILRGDILQTSIPTLCSRYGVQRCFVFGNLPYYITSPILLHLFSARSAIRRMALLMQREVAERVTADPGSRDYGSLSVLAQLDSEPRTILTLPPGAFSPPPKVYSALVDFHMAPRFPQWDEQARQKFLRFVQKCFAQKRKNLLNNLGAAYPRSRISNALEAAAIAASSRAEQLSLQQLAILFGLLSQTSPEAGSAKDVLR